MEGLKIPMLFSAPHSFDAVPIELLFASFKSDDVNPNHLPQGKRYVVNIQYVLKLFFHVANFQTLWI